MRDIIPTTRAVIARLIRFIESRPALSRLVTRFALAHERWQGFRQYGLMRDDIISEEEEIVRAAIERLSDKEAFDRTFRLRRAVQLHVAGKVLAPEEQIPPEKDVPYLWKHVEAISRELEEKKMYDNLQPKA